MSTLTIELDNGVADILEKSAGREHQAVAGWAAERLKLAASVGLRLA